MTVFTDQVLKIIASIPSGKVMTYGQIARAAGSPRGARQVVRILHSMSEKHKLPWHRVVNAKGEISFRDPEMSFTQKSLLEAEGIVFVKDKVISLERFQWEFIGSDPWQVGGISFE